MTERLIMISSSRQDLTGYENDKPCFVYPVSTGKNGMGEMKESECTPRGWHEVHAVVGKDCPVNSVFVARQWTGEVYSEALAREHPGRDWILTRIIQLNGLEPGRNQGGDVDSLQRYIYIHGTPDSTVLGIPGSRGCIRVHNQDMLKLAEWVKSGLKVYIE